MSERASRVALFSLAILVYIGGCDKPGQVFQATPDDVAQDAGRLADTWIRYWNEKRPRELPLADDFVHESPFGRIEGRDTYLRTVIPMAEKNVVSLEVSRVMARENQAVIQFRMHTPHGVIDVCDWITVEGDRITAVHSFYDASLLRAAYSPTRY